MTQESTMRALLEDVRAERVSMDDSTPNPNKLHLPVVLRVIKYVCVKKRQEVLFL